MPALSTAYPFPWTERIESFCRHQLYKRSTANAYAGQLLSMCFVMRKNSNLSFGTVKTITWEQTKKNFPKKKNCSFWFFFFFFFFYLKEKKLIFEKKKYFFVLNLKKTFSSYKYDGKSILKIYDFDCPLWEISDTCSYVCALSLLFAYCPNRYTHKQPQTYAQT